MVNDYVLSCLRGDGPLQASIQPEPVENIELRPNVLFNLLEEKTVLHLGCTDHLPIIQHKLNNGVYLHRQLTYVARECLGIDINQQAATYLKGQGIGNIIIADITQPGIPAICEKQWDYLLMAEMLEHINDPVSFLRQIKENYQGQIGGVVITVPNAFGLIHMQQALHHGIESVNSDHRYWFTPYTLCKVVYEAGLHIDQIIMCLYESSTSMLEGNRELLREKPILLDEIVLRAHF